MAPGRRPNCATRVGDRWFQFLYDPQRCRALCELQWEQMLEGIFLLRDKDEEALRPARGRRLS
jgi:hypothetical protein